MNKTPHVVGNTKFTVNGLNTVSFSCVLKLKKKKIKRETKKK